jgi:hypothetical protein
VSKPFAWSWSTLNAFETCPWRYKLTKITKQVVEPQSKEMGEGNRQHKAMENAIKGVAGLPPDMRHWQGLVDRIRMTPGKITPERKVALTPYFAETTYFAKDVWFRAQYDVEVLQPARAILLDWKTGKRKLDTQQLQLSAASAFSLYPFVQEVETGYVWLPDRKVDRETYTRDQAPDLWAEFLPRVKRIEIAVANDNFPKTPSGLCRAWCPVGRALCEHCGEK